MKILNLYAGIGGNRKLWTDVEVTAIELNPQIAKVYQDFFPKDKVIVADAHQYLLDHFKEFEFIWSSPPCPSHSGCNTFLHAQGIIRYPEMELWQEIIFLKHWFRGKYCVENVESYYMPFIKPFFNYERHYFWTNFIIYKKYTNKIKLGRMGKLKSGQRGDDRHKLKALGFDLSKYSGINKEHILRNCVNPELGLHILNESKRDIQAELFR